MQSKVRKQETDIKEHPRLTREEEIEELYSKLQRYCQFISQNKWVGEDLAQESFLKAWLHYKYQPEISAALVNKIAHNEWIDTIRKRNKETLEDIPEQSQNETEQIVNRFEAIQQLIHQLTPKQAIMFALKEGFQFQLSEIAELLDTSEAAVKAAIFRAKQRLGKKDSEKTNPLIEQYWNEDERQHIEIILYESFKAHDPSPLIRSIPNIRSLRKDDTLTCTMKKPSPLFNRPSGTVYMAA
ncbi:sigma-70 family RNA polymerase sigma factor [Robertmurraya sp. FSL R5-0851]|uniref:sigma-70 family RNA polymerase sigma factor n=1 Tax=Robertmurraya sp. FSL R5-0851 TaxID=2921584 RepID=UPI0030FABD0F